MNFTEYPASELRYLPRAAVIECCAEIDVLAVVEDALVRHGRGQTMLPEEAYLGWETSAGTAARSLAMPGGLRLSGGLALGVKTINGNLGNPDRGLARSQGLLMMFDPEIAWPRTIMESAYLSATRTAAVTALTARLLGRPGMRGAALIGCGTLAKAHLALLPAGITEVCLYDRDPLRARALAEAVRDRIEVRVAADAESCVRGRDLVVTVTTVTEGYLPFEWLAPGALVAHVSLDDVLPDVVRRAGLVVVDDWDLVRHDHRRLLGRLHRDGLLLGPDGGSHPGVTPEPSARRVDTTLAAILTGAHPGRRSEHDVVLSNPFGMSILDIALGQAVEEVAARRDAGVRLAM
ncbi:2,3-diaminopropionate biosynthesis protein SbnB [Acrocarpospora macrocephala]|uniref:2,3-diaminopropionate biosynthesis protein SbnB n=1 Tax=Acrocarpospora macrocephala TaxID=150177 RepID=A0A5M3WX43_9ACTN|nr:ornithine cyclodeaminase [Acrocarpospora macrocephala]GES11871.1 2,3-diaminopropionate biosynthesis protein SbnB [Acrocarpospora macrocephala]